MDGTHLTPLRRTHQTHISSPTYPNDRLSSLNVLFQKAVQGSPESPLASVSDGHKVVHLIDSVGSDILRSDFPEIPDEFLVKLPDRGPPMDPLQTCFKKPLPVVKPPLNDPVGVLFHQSRSTPPLFKLCSGAVPLDESSIQSAAKQLLLYYLNILSPNEAHHLYETCFQDPIIAENLLLPALMNRGVVLRSPLEREFPALQPLLPDHSFEALYLRQNVMDGRLFMITPLYLPFFPSGVILLDILPRQDGSVCRIESLYIPENERRKGLGSLLIHYAVLWACHMQCREIHIDATPQNLIFCLKLGFRPIHPHLTAENWQALRFPIHLAYTHNYCLTKSKILILPLYEYNQTLEEMRQRVLDPNYFYRWPI